MERASTETITGLHWWNDRLLTFTTTRSPDYSFIAGQYARLGLYDALGQIWRAYSMTSAPDARQLEFYGILVPNGLFTTRLKTLQPGSPILVEKQPYGFMTPDRFSDGEDLWMFATGTGIGPYISMLRDTQVWRKFRKLVLVHGVRHAGEFAYRDELEKMCAAPRGAARLHLLRAVTRDAVEVPAVPGAPAVLHGRVTALLESGSLEHAAGLALTPEASRVMLCGNPRMIEDMRALLHARGMRPQRRLAPGQFITENYW